MERINFENNVEIGAFACLTNNYALVGRSNNRKFYSAFEEILDIPIIETTINNIKLVGSQVIGNRHGLILPHTTSDIEFLHIRNSLPENVKVVRIEDRLNAFGNLVLCNDFKGICSPIIKNETRDIIADALNIELIKHPLGENNLVGSYGLLNNQGLLVHPTVSEEDINDFKNFFNVQVVAGSVNGGSKSVGGGAIINDFIGFVGNDSTNTELSIMNSVFNLRSDEPKKLWVETLLD